MRINLRVQQIFSFHPSDYVEESDIQTKFVQQREMIKRLNRGNQCGSKLLVRMLINRLIFA